jgi:CheY-like chemotaxis protein
MKSDLGNAHNVSEGVKVLDRNVRVQMQLIEDLLDMSRIVSGKIRLEMQRVNLEDVVDAALDSVAHSAAAKEIRLEKAVDEDARHITGDPGRLQQVLWNLLTNGIKFTPRGGKVFIRCRRLPAHVEISVRDTGEGIPPEFLPHLFERFTQANGSITREHGGLGLGLSIVRNLVEMHAGTIRAESFGSGQGATFTIELPVLSLQDADTHQGGQTLPAPSDSEPAAALKLKGIKVLVVDDDADAREVVFRFLQQSEAIPMSAASAAEAQALLDSFRPDVIVSDIGMPIQDGYEFIRSVRVQGSKIPAIALTAFARPEDRIRSIQAGYQMHLTKPVEPTELIAVVASLAGLYGAPQC